MIKYVMSWGKYGKMITFTNQMIVNKYRNKSMLVIELKFFLFNFIVLVTMYHDETVRQDQSKYLYTIMQNIILYLFSILKSVFIGYIGRKFMILRCELTYMPKTQNKFSLGHISSKDLLAAILRSSNLDLSRINLAHDILNHLPMQFRRLTSSTKPDRH